MTLQDLGSIGEFVAAIATLATLAYLALQIRQNTGAPRAQTTAAVASEMQRNLLALAECDALAQAFVKAAQSAELSPVEITRLLMWWGSFIRSADSHIVQADLRTLSEDATVPTRVVLRHFLQIPILRDSFQSLLDQEANSKTFSDWAKKNVLL